MSLDTLKEKKVGLGVTVVRGKKFSRPRPRTHAVNKKNPGKVRARTYGTKSPSRSEALRFIDSDGDLAESTKCSAMLPIGKAI